MSTTTKRYNKELKFEEVLPKRKDGLCRCGCGERLASGQRVWRDGHAKIMVDRFRVLKGGTAEIREYVFKRDRGMCAECRLDTEAARKRCRRARRVIGFSKLEAVYAECSPEDGRFAEDMRLRGYPSPSDSWWQADHILEVVRGGGAATLEYAREAILKPVDLSNFQTLCVICHRKKTGRLATERAAQRQGRGPKNSGPLLLGFEPVATG